jgi:hypothetical protein
MRKLLGEKVISQGLWPPRSPNFSPPYLFYGTVSKWRAYDKNPHSKKGNIGHETLRRVARNVAKQVNVCILKRGDRFQHLF